MRDSSTTTPQRPSVPPGSPPLSEYVDWLWANHAAEIEFVVLFGSRARGDAMEESDYDLIVGLCATDGLRLTDRIGVYQDTLTGRVQVLPYPASEVEQMLEDRNGLALNALADGIPLFDRGAWSRLEARFRACVESGSVRRFPGGWEF